MKNIINLFLSILIIIVLIGCSKDENVEDVGIPTVLKGHVSDNIRDENISGYKIVFQKSWDDCSNWACGIVSQDIATTYTDNNGNYSIEFNYKLKEGERYNIEEQYYGYPYFPEYLATNTGITAGQTNILDINAWKPITLKLNVNVTNNVNAPLRVRNQIENQNHSFLNTESFYELNTTKTVELKSRPNSDIKIIFYYGNSVATYREKVYLYHTTFEDVNILNYNIDCSTF
jgi:hypothetical protein